MPLRYRFACQCCVARSSLSFQFGGVLPGQFFGANPALFCQLYTSLLGLYCFCLRECFVCPIRLCMSGIVFPARYFFVSPVLFCLSGNVLSARYCCDCPVLCCHVYTVFNLILDPCNGYSTINVEMAGTCSGFWKCESGFTVDSGCCNLGTSFDFTSQQCVSDNACTATCVSVPRLKDGKYLTRHSSTSLSFRTFITHRGACKWVNWGCLPFWRTRPHCPCGRSRV